MRLSWRVKKEAAVAENGDHSSCAKLGPWLGLWVQGRENRDGTAKWTNEDDG